MEKEKVEEILELSKRKKAILKCLRSSFKISDPKFIPDSIKDCGNMKIEIQDKNGKTYPFSVNVCLGFSFKSPDFNIPTSFVNEYVEDIGVVINWFEAKIKELKEIDKRLDEI